MIITYCDTYPILRFNMKHPILTDQHIALLTSPERWMLRAAALLGDHPDATLSAEHAAWYRRTRQTHSQRELLIALSGTSSYAVGDSAFAAGSHVIVS